MPLVLFEETYDNHRHFHGYTKGDETALRYIYRHSWQPLFRYGLRIVSDEFAVSCMLQEAFLKGWEFRSSMESMHHIYFFIRQQVTWKCFAWLKKPANRFYRLQVCSMDELFPPDEANAVASVEAGEQRRQVNREKLQLIDAVIPYLHPTKQNLMKLYFEYGYSCKLIARRYGSSAKAISIELQESLAYLKKIIQARKPAPAKRKEIPVIGMDTITQSIFQLRYEQKISFQQIAEKLGLKQSEVQQQYIEAHRLLKKAG